MARKKKTESWGENGFEDWGGYMAAKKAKLAEQFQIEAGKEYQDASNLFEGIAIFVNGYTDPTADELRRLMMEHGGMYHHYMRPRVTTHIIASNLPHSKIVMYRKSQNPLPICKPQWITDSIKAGRVLNFQNYLLYSNCTDKQPQLKYKITDKGGGTNACLDVSNKTDKSSKVDAPMTAERSEKIKEISKQPQLKYEVTDKGGETNGCLSASNKTNESSKVHTPTTDEKNEKVKEISKQQVGTDSGKTANNARSTKDSGFLSEFYNHSRLHHIATMGATFKDYVNELRDKSNGKFPGLEKLKELKDSKLDRPLSGFESSFNDELLDLQDDNKVEINFGPIIMHIDMDCFFVSVGIRDKPELKGLPVAVTHAKGNKQPSKSSEALDDDEYGSLSEVASCSYEARKAGVKNGMFLGEALKMCPNLKTIPYDFEGYKEVSYTLYDTVASYTLDIEAVSCDELYADCFKILDKSGLTPMEFASIIRDEIREKTGCPVSTGFGSNKLLARLATKNAKPDGQFYIKKDDVERCIGAFNVRDLPGVGGTTAHKLNALNVRTCTELLSIPLSVLQREFGKKSGELLYNMCRGIDNSKLNLEHVRKSVSAEVNYGIRFECNDDAIDFLKKLCEEVSIRLKKANAKGRCITFKLMVRAKEAPKTTAKYMGHGLCDYMTRSKNLIAPINDVDIITKEVITLWTQLQQLPQDARGIGIQISRLEILRNKSRDVNLMSYVQKNKQHDRSHPPSEIQVSTNSEVSEKPSKSKNLTEFLKLKPSVSTQSTDPGVSTAIASTAVISENTNPGGEHNFEIPSNISESILAELPEDIRNEILNTKVKGNPSNVSDTSKKDNSSGIGTNEKKIEKNVQTRQENFFKHTKPNSGKSAKVEMPSLQEIDMNVLIELPEDIRNEILNEYSANRQQIKSNACVHESTNETKKGNAVATTSKAITTNLDQYPENISFSQVDPEFLAALSDDLRRDVQMYCATKKTENSSKLRKDEEVAQGSGILIGPSASKQSKKVERPSKAKNNGKGTKAVSSKKKKKGIQAAFKNLENKTESKVELKKNIEKAKPIVPSANAKREVNSVTANEAESILSHNRTILENNENASEDQTVLIDLVNHLFNLPLDQVKMQIETWISNSNTVNEVDFLSLATFLSMLPEKKRIEDLHVLLKTMHRCMTKTGNCIWHRTYRKTVKHVQHYMQIEYNSNLMVPPIRCDLLHCNCDVM